ncbi:MAG: dUTP diphosphatase [Termitinemataceae bacterium]|nr:MAG: dUTP diphosphatase [Termitinemataceae bacterium]
MGITVMIKKISQGAILPAYETAGAAGMDVRACSEHPITIEQNKWALIPTGIAMQIPAGFEAQVRPRSGLAAKNGVTVLNAPGTIDSDYRGEIKIILINHGEDTFTVKNGDRIAQFVFAQAATAILQECETLDETKRDCGGLGSTGSN